MRAVVLPDPIGARTTSTLRALEDSGGGKVTGPSDWRSVVTPGLFLAIQSMRPSPYNILDKEALQT
ncbi:putative movement protein [Gallid alphaherpesvirus 3]|uniref:Putative movement protein n=1 Tax=Gallid alphaherpesvirus 3 TaxID=35250 RepID=F8TC00_9ALPH|nr:putative movement protein [Gallid alphaherpesvirus 3]AEI00211.1 putative movement protein [Gallid alphaherpesvirus 3]QEY02326.1 putative movement protein [Gallid alphaherpesvirus 3]